MRHYYTPDCARPMPSIQLSVGEIQVCYQAVVSRLTDRVINGSREDLPDLNSAADKLEKFLEQLCQ